MTYEQWCKENECEPTPESKIIWIGACNECRLAIGDALDAYCQSSMKIKMATDMAYQACINTAGSGS